MFSYNFAIHTSTEFSPHKILFAYKPSLPSSITAQPEFDDYIDNLILKFKKSKEQARNNLIDSKNRNKEYYDKKCRTENYKLGDKVHITHENSKSGRSKKLSPRFTDPYEIIEINSPVNAVPIIISEINNKVILQFQVYFTSIHGELYNITTLKKGGINFEHIGKANKFYRKWNLVTYLEISSWPRKLELIEDILAVTLTFVAIIRLTNFHYARHIL